MEYEVSASKGEDQVMPSFSVFHSPPDAVATQYSLLRSGWKAKSEMRPEVMAGPIGRSGTPASGCGVAAAVRP